MKKDIVNETFNKHLKLLHEHLNINEYSPFEGQNKKLSIREGHSPEVENYYRLVKAGKIPEKQAKEVANLIQNYDYGYQVDDYNEVYQYVTLYAPPNHSEQPGFGGSGIVHVDKDGKHIDDDGIEKMRKQNLKQYPKDRIKPSIREVE
jgi:hypothetical protein